MFVFTSGEGSAVAVYVVLRAMLEEMYAAERLWSVHSGVSTTYSATYTSAKSAK